MNFEDKINYYLDENKARIEQEVGIFNAVCVDYQLYNEETVLYLHGDLDNNRLLFSLTTEDVSPIAEITEMKNFLIRRLKEMFCDLEIYTEEYEYALHTKSVRDKRYEESIKNIK